VRRTAPALLALALGATAAALWPALGGELVYDDLLLVARNPALASVSELAQSFTSAHWDVAQDTGPDDIAPRVGYWRPLTTLALFLGQALGGGDPRGFHAVSLGVHLASVALAFFLVRRFTRNDGIAGAAALLFGLHPVHVESVAWISAVNDPLAGAFTLAALLAYLRWRDSGSSGAPWWSGALLLLGLLAKESALAWFALAPALDAGRTLREGERRFASLPHAFAPAFAAFGAYYLMRVGVFGELAAGFDRITSYLYSSFERRITLRLELLGGALQLLVWPAKLNLFREVRPEAPWDDGPLLTAFAAIGAWLAATVWAARRGPREVFTALLFLPAGLAPALLRFEAIGRFPLSDRFLYLPALGAALLGAAALVRWLPRPAALVGVLALATLAGKHSFDRTRVWKDEETLFRDGVAASPRCMYVHWGLGRVLLERFQRTLDLRVLMEAQEAFDRAQRIAIEKPPDPRVLVTPFDELQSSLGMGWYFVYCSLHAPEECSMDEAELVFREIAKRAPRSPEAHCGLGVALRYLGRFEDAEQSFARGTSENPRHYESWFNLGQLQIQRAKWREALDAFDRATQISPASVEAWVALAMCATELELGDRARAALKRAVQLAPTEAGVQTQLGVLAAREQRFDDALKAFEAALKRDGANGPAHLMRAKTLLFLNRPADALQAFLDASRWLQEPSLDPLRPEQLFEAFYNAGVLCSELGDRAKAIELLEEAQRRDPGGARKEALGAAIETLKAKSD
jgi:tetratricopeptide (TPR) repeat protein